VKITNYQANKIKAAFVFDLLTTVERAQSELTNGRAYTRTIENGTLIFRKVRISNESGIVAITSESFRPNVKF